MAKFKVLLTLLSVFFLIVTVSCGSKGGDDGTPLLSGDEGTKGDDDDDDNDDDVWTPPPSFSITYMGCDNDKNDTGFDIAIDSDDNIFVSGGSDGDFGSYYNQGGPDAFIAKFDSSGNLLWITNAGSNQIDAIAGIDVDSSGNVYGAGYTYGSFDGHTNQGEGDMVLVKYGSSGNKIWTIQRGTVEGDAAYDAAVDNEGNIYFAGHTNWYLEGSQYGMTDLFITKYQPGGTHIKTKQMGSLVNDVARAIDTDSFGIPIISGYTNETLYDIDNAGFRDFFALKYDLIEETKIWYSQLGTTEADSAEAIYVDQYNNTYIAGSTMKDLDGNVHLGLSDAFVIKYNSLGEKLWTKQIGTTEHDGSYAVTADSTGNVFLTGNTTGDMDGYGNRGGNDIFIVKLDADGKEKKRLQFGTPGEEAIRGALVDSNGQLVVTGEAFGDLLAETKSHQSDVFIIKLDTVLSFQ